MFYRYEVFLEGDWDGVFSLFDPDERRSWGRRLTSPKWYDSHPNCKSRCWFTEEGFQKHHVFMEEMLKYHFENSPELKFRLLKRNQLQQLTMSGKIQCIELCEGNITIKTLTTNT